MSFQNDNKPTESETKNEPLGRARLLAEGKALCQFCSRPYAAGQGLTNHERGCALNPARRDRRPQKRRTCPKCRRLIAIGTYERHLPKCKGRRNENEPTPEDEVVIVRPPPLFPDLQAQTTSELLVELLFPMGMPTHAEFVRAFRAWLDATDKLVAIAEIGQ